MWILPKQLHTSDFVPDMEALNLDSNESSQISAQSLFVRSKHSPARTWSQRWKRDSWTQHLSGRILRPSHGQSFIERWTSSLADIHANHSVPPESEQERTTQDISGLGSQTEFDFSNLDAASLKTSKDTSRWDSPQSSAIWKKWVTEQRGEYSQRLKSARHTNASGSLSWPTPQASEGEKITGLKTQDSLTKRMRFGQADQANHSTGGSRQESWLTPRANESDNDPNFAARNADRGLHCHGTLSSQAKAWATPTATDTIATKRDLTKMEPRGHWGKSMNTGKLAEMINYRILNKKIKRVSDGKLNPRWVETLMGLPIGWTMPSCMSPVTIEPMKSDSSATE